MIFFLFLVLFHFIYFAASSGNSFSTSFPTSFASSFHNSTSTSFSPTSTSYSNSAPIPGGPSYEFKSKEERKPSTYSTYTKLNKFSTMDSKKVPEERFFELSTAMLKSLLKEFGVNI